MGVYVNPPDMTKEQWLEENAVELKLEEVADGHLRPDEFIVVLVNNGPFTAAGVAYSDAELNEFTNPRDYRPKRYFLAGKDDLLKVSNLEYYLTR